MNRVLRQLCSGVGAVALAALLTPLSVPVAHAEPALESSPAPVATPSIGWSQLGLADRIDLSGANQPSDVGVRVPEGIAPAALTGSIGSVVSASGRVDVLDARGVTLGSVPIPTDVASVPFVVDISPAEVTAGVAKLSFVIRDDGDQRTDSCAQAPAVTLSQLATTYSGPTPDARTVADFLPGYVDQITIQVGAAPTADEQQAALALVAKLTHLYRPMPVRIDVDTSAVLAAAADTATHRTVAIRDGAPAGFVVENAGTPSAVLVIGGRGPELLRQVELFADRRYDLAQTDSATVTSAADTVPKSAETLSFAELGMTPQASVLGTTTMYLGFDAAAFGVGSVDQAKIHLIAKYTPVTTEDASVLIRSGNTILASAILDESGVVDLTADIPGGTIGSNVGMALEIRYIPRQQCAPLYDRMTFAVDPESTVTVAPGTDNRGGFPVLPMAFTPQFDVALASPDQIRFAAQAINLMGQQSTVALQPTVTSLDDAAARGTGLLVVATGDELNRVGLRAPLLFTGTEAVDVNGSPVTGIDVNGPLGVIEAFANNGRMVLAIDPSGDGSLVDASFDYIRGLESRWATLNGDVVATGADYTTVNLTISAGASMAHQTVPEDGWKWWTWFTIGVGAVAALAVTGVLLQRRHRAKP